jgi:hypothetical protein
MARLETNPLTDRVAALIAAARAWVACARSWLTLGALTTHAVSCDHCGARSPELPTPFGAVSEAASLGWCIDDEIDLCPACRRADAERWAAERRARVVGI